MRIGIVTLPLHTNYGGILQAYALQTVLERMGHDVCVIEEKRKPRRLPAWKAPLAYGKRIVKNMLGHPCPVFYEKQRAKEQVIVRQNTDKFIASHVKQRKVDGFSELKGSEYDAIIVGSDQVWRPYYFREIEHAYLDFTAGWNIRRIAYAASFGTDEWEYTPEQASLCGGLLKSFDAVSVRESSGVDLCLKHFGVKAQHVLDPTMLLAKEDYVGLFKANGTPPSNGTLLCYILDEANEKKAVIEEVAKSKGLVPFYVGSKVETPSAPLAERIQPPLEHWLRGFYDAEFVVTDSFHACVFSIIFNKPFLALGNPQRGMSRFASLLGTFGLGRQLVAHGKMLNASDVDFTSCNSRLSVLKEKSMGFLANALTKIGD